MDILAIIHNLALLTTLVLFFTFATQKWYLHNRFRSLFFGITFGLIAIVGMMDPYHVTDGLFYDGRTIILGVCAFIGGPVSAIVSSALAAIYRMQIGGTGEFVGILSITISSIGGLIAHYLLVKKKNLKNSYIFLTGFIIHLVVLLDMLFLPQLYIRDVFLVMSIPYLVLFPIIFFVIIKIFLDIENSIFKNEENKKWLEAVIQEAPNPIILHSDDGEIIMLNKAWSNISGYTIDEVPTIDAWLERIYDDKERIQKVREHVHGLYKSKIKVDEGDFTFLTKDKKLVTWQFSTAPLGIMNNKRTFVSSAMDITELKQKDEMMIIQSRSAAMGEMISMIAHQWRQPLSVISINANNMLASVELNGLNIDEVVHESKEIIEQTKYLSKTIDDFRNFFKPTKELEKVNIKKLIDDALIIMSKSLEHNNIECKIISNIDVVADVYSRELVQVFINILQNAKEALVEYRDEKREIAIEIVEMEKFIVVKICNNCGEIESKNMNRIFEPYFTTKDEHNGTGLGLYMSKMIIDQHLKGSLEFMNIDGGVCFSIKLFKKLDGDAK